jgi:tRNA (guanine-N7-)-methyltransferase
MNEDSLSHVPVGQVGLHPGLQSVVLRHLQAEDRSPISQHTKVGFEQLKAVLEASPRPVVLDSGCGTGMGAAELAKLRPEAWVIGVDQSYKRLRKGPGRDGLRHGLSQKDNLLILRADVPGLWTLMAQAGLKLETHYLLYPNPWPKKRHLMRRWHAHPAFSALCKLGGHIELRTNWLVYAEEMACALDVAGARGPDSGKPECEPFEPTEALTKFEAKYAASKHILYRVQAVLP